MVVMSAETAIAEEIYLSEAIFAEIANAAEIYPSVVTSEEIQNEVVIEYREFNIGIN